MERGLRYVIVAGVWLAMCGVSVAAPLPDVGTEDSTGGIRIEHSEVSCVVAEQHPCFEARLEPIEEVRGARVYFSPEGGRHWYSVAMERRDGTFVGIIPKPKHELKGLDYYIEAAGEGIQVGRTADFSPVVESGVGACKGGRVAAALGSAIVTVAVPAAPPGAGATVLAGFSTEGVTLVTGTAAVGGGSAAGAAAAATTGASAGSSGMSTAVIVGGVAGAGAVAGVVALAAGGEDEPENADVSGRWTGTAHGTMTLPGVAEVCEWDWGIEMDLQQSGVPISADPVFTLLASAGPRFPSGTGPFGHSDPCDLDYIGRSGVLRARGSVSGTSISFEVTNPDPDATLRLAFTGTVQQSQMSGTYSGSHAPGADDSGTWSLRRP